MATDADGAPTELFIEFHKAASARKMDLAMRSLPVPNVMVDDLFELAQAAGIDRDGWEAFLLGQLPSPRAAAASGDGHTLLRLAESLTGSLHGDDDVDIGVLTEASKAVVSCIEGLGAWGVLSVKEAATNLAKIEAGSRSHGSGGGSLNALLKAEVRASLHGAGGMLADASAAMGVLWLCRFLRFWEQLVLLRSSPPPPTGGVPSFKESIEAAYEATLLPWHGWVTQKAFSVAVQAAPEWDDVLPAFAPSEAEFGSDAKAWCVASDGVISRIMATLEAMDLVDTRKSM